VSRVTSLTGCTLNSRLYLQPEQSGLRRHRFYKLHQRDPSPCLVLVMCSFRWVRILSWAQHRCLDQATSVFCVMEWSTTDSLTTSLATNPFRDRVLTSPAPNIACRLACHFCAAVAQRTIHAAQNSHAVTHVEYASVEMIRATIDALESDLPPAAVKLGMMGTDAVVSVVGAFLDGYEGKVVCDPVMVSTRCGRRRSMLFCFVFCCMFWWSTLRRWCFISLPTRNSVQINACIKCGLVIYEPARRASEGVSHPVETYGRCEVCGPCVSD